MMTATDTPIHPFEKAGLGVAPFSYAGYSENAITYPDGRTQAAGTCDYCSNGIRHQFHIRSADGKTFKVGCDCVRKLDRIDNRLMSEVERKMKAVEKAARNAKADAIKARERERISAAFARLDDPMVAERFAAMPDPNGFNWTDGIGKYRQSLAGYIAWMRKNAGHTGMLKVARMIETTLA